MIEHKYAAGDVVELLPSLNNGNGRAIVYTIIRLMPVTGRGCQYRARNATDNYERVLDEAQLRGAEAQSRAS